MEGIRERAQVSPASAPRPRALPRAQPRADWLTFVAFALLVCVQAFSLVRQQTPLHEDDALFFFRYADNLAAGHGYRWNPEEPPVWGASAPLWPLLLAVGETLGLTAPQASLVWSWILALGAALTLGWIIHRLFGGVLALTPLLAIQHLYSTWSTSGMESPLTFFLVALALLAASGRGTWLFTGLVTGSCLVHKLDLAPLGCVLLAGTFVWRREHALRSVLVAAAVALAWYGFAVWHFGSPIPNSFLSKLNTQQAHLPREWFAEVALLLGAGAVRVLLSCVGLFALRRRPFLASVALAQVLVPTLAYTLRPPAEGFMWYAAAPSPALAFLAACGLAFALRADPRRRPRPLHLAVVTAALIGLGAWLVRKEYPYVDGWHAFLESHQRPMELAGRWVDEHAPREARVITGWGMPAYYSRRFVYDASFLNRRPEEGQLFRKYRPEVWIQLDYGKLADFKPSAPYRVVQAFTSPQQDFYVAVLFRQGTEPL